MDKLVDPAPTSAQAEPTVTDWRPAGCDVVVVNYRTPTDLEGFLASYAAHGCFWGGSLTVVNVSPMPADLAVVKRWEECIDLTHITFKENVGYARACNRGALVGQGDVVALFNADVVLRADALTHCYEAIRDNPTWGVLGPRQVDDRNRLVGCGIYGLPDQPRQGAWMQTDVGQCSSVRLDALTVSGSAYFVRRDVWEMLTACPIYQEVCGGADGGFLPTPHY